MKRLFTLLYERYPTSQENPHTITFDLLTNQLCINVVHTNGEETLLTAIHFDEQELDDMPTFLKSVSFCIDTALANNLTACSTQGHLIAYDLNLLGNSNAYP